MLKIVYLGPSDRRELSEADLTRLGVDNPRDYSFNKGQTQEVANALGELLTTDGRFFGEFRPATDEELAADEREAAVLALEAQREADALALQGSVQDAVDGGQADAHVQDTSGTTKTAKKSTSASTSGQA